MPVLAPLIAALGVYVRSADKLHADDTPVPVLTPGRGQTKTGRLWTYVRDDRPAGCEDAPAVWFAYSPDRKGEHPQAHLKDFAGLLQADAYAGFNTLYEGGKIKEIACWAHARRKFYDSQPPTPAHWPMKRCARSVRCMPLKNRRGRAPKVRQRVRQEQAVPILASSTPAAPDPAEALAEISTG